MARFSRILVTDKTSAKATSAAVAAPPEAEALALESDYVIILAVLLCALICVVGLIAAARCAWRRRNGIGGRYPSPPAGANKGVKKKVLQSLPKFTYTAKTTTTAGAAAVAAATASLENDTNCGGAGVKLAPPLAVECAICLGEFVEGDEIRVLPQCGHSFHVACIDKWLGSHSTCPSCRQILVVDRCQKCGQFPAVSAPAAAGTRPGSEPQPQLNNYREDRLSTTTNNNITAFLP